MDAAKIAALLSDFLPGAGLSETQLQQTAQYLNLLLKWNARTNLTAVRAPEAMLSRHFGESFFAATMLYPQKCKAGETLIDFGSGAGFPGLPIKILVPELQVTLVESQNKKATFLKEVVRALGLKDIQVHQGRAEDSGLKAQTVTMRAVEKFEVSASAAASLVEPRGRLALLIGAPQVKKAQSLLPDFQRQPAIEIPQSEQRVLLVGNKQ